MLYRNIKNGTVIDIPSVLTDPNWEAVKEQPLNTSSGTTKKAVRSNGRKRKEKLCDNK